MSVEDDFNAAFNATHRCLALANTLGMLVEDYRTSTDEDYREYLAKAFGSELISLSEWINQAEDLVAPFHAKHCDACENGAMVAHSEIGARCFQTFHEAALNIAVRIFEKFWMLADRRGTDDNFLDEAALAQGLPLVSSFFERREIPTIDSVLFQKLEQEAVIAGRLLTNGEDDTKSDTGKKRGKTKRPMNTAAADCVRRYKESISDGLKVPMETVVSDYVEEVGKGSVQSIMRTLSDNPERWKADTKPT